MRRRLVLGVSIFVASGVTACGALLGDFTVGDAGAGDSSVADTGGGADSGPDVRLDVGLDVPVLPDTGPQCGQPNQFCCPQAPQCLAAKTACCGSTCVPTDTDPKNCGACGRDCLGSKCVGGACQPLELGGTTSKEPTALVLTQQSAFFATFNANNGALWECDLQTLCPSGAVQRISGVAFAGDLTQEPGNVLLSDFNASKIYYWDKSAKSFTTKSIQSPGAVEIGAGRLFLASASIPLQANPDLTNQVALNNGNSEGVVDVTTDGSHVYYARSVPNDVRVATVGQGNSAATFWVGSNTAQLASITAGPQSVAWIATDINTGKSQILACATGATCPTATILAANELAGYRLGNLAIFQGDVYWTVRDGFSKQVELHRCAANGCQQNPKVLAVVPTNGLAVPGGVAVDSQFAYFLVGDSTGTHLFRVPTN